MCVLRPTKKTIDITLNKHRFFAPLNYNIYYYRKGMVMVMQIRKRRRKKLELVLLSSHLVSFSGLPYAGLVRLHNFTFLFINILFYVGHLLVSIPMDLFFPPSWGDCALNVMCQPGPLGLRYCPQDEQKYEQNIFVNVFAQPTQF